MTSRYCVDIGSLSRYYVNMCPLRKYCVDMCPLSGALDGGPQCRMSNSRNGNVPCRYLCIPHVDFKIA